MAVHLRDATRADLAVVAELIRALAEYEHLEAEVMWSEEELASSLLGPGAVAKVVLAEADDAPGVVAGLAIWFPTYSTFRGRPGIWLEDLFVRPEHRGRGVGRALLDHLFERAGDGRVEWAVLDWNTPSIAFYQSVGARPVDGWTIYRWLRQTGDSQPGNSQAGSEPEPEQ
jgi:GNAT superfamily N-acetyltransferase